jgi:uncharacterized protein (DUF983 family)
MFEIEPTPDTQPISTNFARVCPRCGDTFSCGVANGENDCWCFALPNVISLEGDGAGTARSCLCPACLSREVFGKLNTSSQG